MSRTPTEDEEELTAHVRVDVPETREGQNGWETLTLFLQQFVGHMETYVWPVDPYADIHPTMLPFLYTTVDGEQDERFLKELLYLLTIGLQGQGFGWRYKMLFDVHWNHTKKGYLAELTSIRRVRPQEMPKPPVSEAKVSDPKTD